MNPDNFWQKKRVTVTGGRGFLGKHLIRHLRDKGYEHIHVADLPEYNLVRLDDVHRMYETTRPDVVIHLAAKVGGIGFNQENPASLFYDNIMMGTQLIHEGCMKKIDKFVALVPSAPIPSSLRSRFERMIFGTGIRKKPMRPTDWPRR